MSLYDYDSEMGTSMSDSVAPTTMGVMPHEEEEAKKEPQTTRIELMDITEKERPYGDRPLIIPTSTFNQAKDIDAKYLEYALLLRRKVDKDNNRLKTTLEIWSPIVRAALQEILAQCSYLNLAACPIEISQPYHALFHYRKELRSYAESPERTEDEKKHFGVLISFMSANLARIEREYDQHEPKGHITFKLLWTLFRPETIVVLQTDHFRECYRVDNCTEVVIRGEVLFEISVWSWEYNGISFGPTKSKIHIKDFQGARPITEMQIYPLWLLPEAEKEELEHELIARGRKWRSLVDKSHRHYKGPVWIKPPFKDVESIKDLVLMHVDGRVFLDYNSHQENNYEFSTVLYGQGGAIKPKARQPSRPLFPYLDRPGALLTDMKVTEDQMRALNDMKCYQNTAEYDMSDYQALLCPARIRGFSLIEKQWGFFLVDKVRDIKWSESVFEKLEMDSSIKSKVQALVETHYTDTFDDMIAGKGKGLVVLLHGPPGTGKTLTAESIAEHTHKPLYYIGAGELGMDVGMTEDRLRRIFDMAKSWGSILLLDEADVFLAKRTRDDMRRNGFVSVFLRLLEYYEGILFLTTNRIEEFDPAFQSRIHLRLAYDDLSPEKRANIWRNLLDQVECCRDWHESVYKKLGRDMDLNGREIKNLIRTALAISSHKGSPLTTEIISSLYDLNYSQGNLMNGTSAFGPAAKTML